MSDESKTLEEWAAAVTKANEEVDACHKRLDDEKPKDSWQKFAWEVEAVGAEEKYKQAVHEYNKREFE